MNIWQKVQTPRTETCRSDRFGQKSKFLLIFPLIAQFFIFACWSVLYLLLQLVVGKEVLAKKVASQP